MCKPVILMESIPSWEPTYKWDNNGSVVDMDSWDGKTVRINKEWKYKYTDDSIDLEFEATVKPGFITDGGSIPRFAWGMIAPFGIGLPGYLIHDALYATWYLPRDISDKILYDTIRYAGMGWIKSNIVYHAVRTFGGSAWKGHVTDKKTDDITYKYLAKSRDYVDFMLYRCNSRIREHVKEINLLIEKEK